MFTKHVSRNSVLAKVGSLSLSIYIVAISFSGVAFPMSASALTTTDASPTTNAADGATSWNNPTNAYSNGSGAASNIANNDRHRYGGFGISVPAGVNVTGITVKTDAWASGSSCDLVLSVSQDGGATWSAGKTVNLGTSEATLSAGSDSDLWGFSSWTSTQISNLLVRVQAVDGGSHCNSGTDTVSVDWLRVAVDYASPQIQITTINGQAVGGACTGTLAVTVAGSGSSSAPPGDASQYRIQIDWGDASVTNGLGVFTPNSGHVNFTYTFSGTHTYAVGGNYTIKARLYHQSAPGQDNQADAVAAAVVCVTSLPTTGGLTVTKTTTGGDGTFTFNGNGSIGTFTITTVGGTGKKDFFNLATTTSYTITETVPAGWAQNSNTCSNISVIAGSTSTCAVANTKKATVNVIKQVINDNGGTAVASNFTMNVTGTNASQTTFAGSASGVAVTLDPGAFTVSETANASYAMTTTGDCSGTIAAGETKTCTIINNDIAPKLTLNKVVNGDDEGGPFGASAWTLTASGVTSISGTTGVTSDASFKAGVYNLSESTQKPHYTASGWVCPGGSLSGSSLTIGLGQNITCNITNTYTTPTPGTIKIVKNTVGGDGVFSFQGGEGIGNFTIETEGGTGSKSFSGLASEGTYSVSEVDEEGGWALTDVACFVDGDSEEELELSNTSLYLAAGASITCTFTNTKPGHIIVKKVTVPAESEESFHFSTTYNGEGFNLMDGEQNDSGELAPGSYNVTEQLGEGSTWAQDAVCDDGSSIKSVVLDAGETVTCTFTNTSTLADVGVEKTIDDNTPMRGQTITYTIVASNAGPSSAADVVVTDSLPSGITAVSSSATVGSYSTSTNEWTIGTLASGASATLTITATVNENQSIGTMITNTATINSDNADSNEQNDGSSVTATVAAGNTECSDGIDNDNDESVDFGGEGGDSNCDSLADDSESAIVLPVCSDGIDNEGDGKIDSEDPSCHDDFNASNPASYVPTRDDESRTPPSNGGGGGAGGNGPIFGGSFGNGPVGQVLGASTTLPELPAGCVALLDTYMRQFNKKNNAADVKDLQSFLNTEMNAGLPVTGTFGPMTDKWVRAFQTKYADQTLTPWGLTGTTGFVYKTTQRWVNLIHCKTLSIPVPTDLTPYHHEDE